jgi:hypothetical protein
MSVEEFKKLEEQLRQLKPRAPRAEVRFRIEGELAKAGRSRKLKRFRTVSAWTGMAAAASILITSGILLFNGRMSLDAPVEEQLLPEEPPLTVGQIPDEPVDAFEPVLAENNLKSRVDEGIVFLKNGLTARRYRYEFVDRVVWRNPADGAVVEMEIPRDEVVLIPVRTF